MRQPDAPPRRVAGRVVFEGQPVPDALVRLEPKPFPEGLRAKLLRTGADGRFDFGLQAPLTWSVAAAAPGRAEANVSVDLRDPTASPASDALELELLPCEARLTGHVMDSGSGPVEHARVRPQSGIGVETNARGEYELCLSPGRASLHVSADGYGAVWLGVLVLGHTTRDVILTPEAFLVGRVVDEANAPVPDALVMAWNPSPEGVSSASALSGADGRFRLSVAPTEYRLSARSKTGSTSSVTTATAIVGRVSDEVVLRLQTKGVLRGHVRSGSKPIAGAHVQAMGAASARGSEAVSQEDGSFVLTQVPVGDLVFFASPWEVVSPKHFTMKKGDDTVELEVKPMASLHGVVTREGKPVAGAHVQANAGMRMHDATADAKGQYVVRGLTAGAWTVYATSERAGAFTEAKVTLGEREDKQLDLELSSAGTISGRVVSEKGEPVPGAFVVYELPTTHDEGRSITDADGHFMCNLMTGGGEYQPTVYPSQTSRTPYKAVTPPLPKALLKDGNSRVDGVTLTIKYERLTVTGRVVDPSGAPVPDAKVRAAPDEGGRPPSFNPWMPLPTAVTDAQGAFTVEALTSGTWALQARSPEGAEATVNGIAAGAKDVVVTVRPPGGIEGTLVGYEEVPVVYARSVGQAKFQPAQVEGSTFRVQLAAGTYLVTAMNLHEGDAQRVEVREGEMTKVTMTSHGRGTIHGSVVEHTTRAPVPNLVCHTVVRAGTEAGITNWDQELSPRTGADGKFTVDPAPAGDVSVSCFGDWGTMSSASAQVVVPRGGTLDVALEVVKRSTDTPGDIGADLADVLRILQLKPQGPAAKAGLLVGDVIVAVDGAPVAPLDGSGVEMLISNHVPGTKVTLGIMRGTQPMNVTLTTAAPE